METYEIADKFKDNRNIIKKPEIIADKVTVINHFPKVTVNGYLTTKNRSVDKSNFASREIKFRPNISMLKRVYNYHRREKILRRPSKFSR